MTVWGVGQTPTPGTIEASAQVTKPLSGRNPPEPIAVIEGAHGNQVLRQAYSPDGRLLATSSHDGIAKLWRVARAPKGPKLTLRYTLDKHTATVHAVAFSPDGRRLATAGFDGKVGLFHVESGEGELFAAHKGRVTSVSFDASGERLLSAGINDFMLRLWDITQSPPVLAAPPLQSQDMILWATLRPDARQLAAVGRGAGKVTLQDIAPGAGDAWSAQPTRLVGHEQTVFRAEYSPDGRQLATVGGDITLRLWDLGRNKPLFTLRLPTKLKRPSPLWDFALRCLPAAGDATGAPAGTQNAARATPNADHCILAAPLTAGRLALYRLPYRTPPPAIRDGARGPDAGSNPAER